MVIAVMARLQLSFLGAFQAHLDGQPLRGFVSQKVRALLAYLCVERDRPHSRERLAALFWPDRPEPLPRKNLRDALANLRKVLREEETDIPFLSVSRWDLRFNPQSDYWLDVEAFTDWIEAAHAHRHRRLETCRPCVQRIERAVALYRGDFLSGLVVNGSPRFHDWLIIRQERYRQMALEALSVLVAHYERRRQYRRAIEYARLQVEMDPWQEAAHRQMMRLLALSGNRSAAIRQFHACAKILAQELSVEPVQETRDLYARILRGEVAAASASPGAHLPQDGASFVGRTAELEQLRELLQQPGCRMVTIAGQGGAGKTRLALRLAAEEAYAFRDGAHFVPVTGLRSAEALWLALAERLGVALQRGKPPRLHVLTRLREREMLLLLDGFEHLLARDAGSADVLADIVRQCAGVVLLVTSREVVRLRAERVFRLGGLACPPEEPEAAPQEAAAQYPALRLFLERARSVQPDFSLEENLADVARICRLLDGLPLGVELAAGWVHRLSCRQIAAAVEDNLSALSALWKDVPDRHRSLEAVFAYSWGMLSDEERGFLRAISVFWGGFEAQAAGAVAACGDAAAGRLLAALADKSLVQAAPGGGRYEMHSLIRQFALRKLAERPEAQRAAYRRHAAWYAAFLQLQEAGLEDERILEALERIRRESVNVRLAWRWMLEHRALDLVEQCAAALFSFYLRQGWTAEGAEAFSTAVETLQSARDVPPALRARLRAYHGAFVLRDGAPQRARPLLEEALNLARSLGERETAAFCSRFLGEICERAGEYEAASAWTLQALDVYREAQDYAGQGVCSSLLARISARMGRHSEARRLWEQSLHHHVRSGNLFEKMGVLNNLGTLLRYTGDYARSEAYLREALEIAETLQNPYAIAGICNNLGLLARHRGMQEQARAFLQRSLALCEEMGEQQDMILCLNNLGLVAQDLGEYARARQLHRRGYDLSVKTGQPYWQASSLRFLGMVLTRMQAYPQAQRALQDALNLSRRLGADRHVGMTLVSLGQLACAAGEHARACGYLRQAAHLALEKRQTDILVDVLGAGLELWHALRNGSDPRVEIWLRALYHAPDCSWEVGRDVRRLAAALGVSLEPVEAAPPLEDILRTLLDGLCPLDG